MRLKVALLPFQPSLSSFLRFFPLSLEIDLRFADMSSQYSHIAPLVQNGLDAHMQPRSIRRPNVSNVSHTTPINSHYHDLRQLEMEPEDDLIDFESGPSNLQSQTGSPDVPVHRSGRNLPESGHGLSTYQTALYVTQRNFPVLMQLSKNHLETIVFNHT